MLKQFKQVDSMHQEIIALSAMILLLEQKRALSTSVSSSSENGNYADIPSTREATIRRVQACKFQTMIAGIALQLSVCRSKPM